MMEHLKRILCLIVLVTAFVLLQGCATVLHGPSQHVSVSSNPSGAIVEANGAGSWKTPTRIKLARKRDHILIIRKEGYEDEQVVIMHVISGAVAGNILAGGLIGWGIDAMTGAQYRLVPETVHVELKPLKPGSPEATSPLIHMSAEEKLKRLKGLLDEELITQEEYEAMRKIILEKVAEE